MRGTPLMLQMLFIYYALPFVPGSVSACPIPWRRSWAFCAQLRAAYFAEIFRAGIQSIDRG